MGRENGDMTKHVFISYSTKDKDSAEKICSLVEARGIRCWIALRDMVPGKPYGEQIIGAIESTAATVVILSGDANASSGVASEVERAFAKKKLVIPFRIQNVEPSRALELFISGSQWIDAWLPPLEARIDRLASTIIDLLGIKPVVPAAPVVQSEPSPLGYQTGSELGILLHRSRAMCWEGHWNLYPLAKMQVRINRDNLEITNTVVGHYHARVVMDHVLRGDFRSELELKGQYRDLQLVDACGEDRNIYINPSELSIDIEQWQKYSISRQDGKLRFEHNERGTLPFGNYHSDPGMICLISIALMTGQTVAIRSWVCSEEAENRSERTGQ